MNFVFVIFAAVETLLVLGCALGFFFNMGSKNLFFFVVCMFLLMVFTLCFSLLIDFRFKRDWKKIEAFVGLVI